MVRAPIQLLLEQLAVVLSDNVETIIMKLVKQLVIHGILL